jgi:hypothetical protein
MEAIRELFAAGSAGGRGSPGSAGGIGTACVGNGGGRGDEGGIGGGDGIVGIAEGVYIVSPELSPCGLGRKGGGGGKDVRGIAGGSERGAIVVGGPSTSEELDKRSGGGLGCIRDAGSCRGEPGSSYSTIGSMSTERVLLKLLGVRGDTGAEIEVG